LSDDELISLLRKAAGIWFKNTDLSAARRTHKALQTTTREKIASMTHTALPIHIDSTMITCARSCLQKFKLGSSITCAHQESVSTSMLARALAGALEKEFVGKSGNTIRASAPLIMAEARFFQEWGERQTPRMEGHRKDQR
jgi:hypothetical protein